MLNAEKMLARGGLLAGAIVLGLTGASCANELSAAPSDEPGDNRELFSADDEAVVSAAITASYPTGSILRTTTGLNLRSGASTGYRILVVMPSGARVTLRTSAPRNGWYNVRYGSTDGWAYGGYLALVSTPSTGTSGPDRAIARARSGVGFSYWWGGGAWLSSGPTSSTRGSCTPTCTNCGCPNCRHSGRYGADCSGYVAKAWTVPSSNSTLSVNQHPYSTYNFYSQQTHWRPISRSSIKRADALVYRSGGGGHIALYESGSPWGSLWAMEARGCRYGIVRNVRSFSSSYKTIRRSGY